MRKFMSLLSSIVFGFAPFLAEVANASDQTKDDERLKNCGSVLKEILDVPDNMPQGLLDKADCVVVFPSVVKAAFIVGGSYGRGAMTCRQGENFQGPWGAPTMMALEGGSFGFQIGGQATDFVLLVMNESGARGILASKVKLGGDASVAAGPVGRDASAGTDASLRSEILSYSRARGLFAGVSSRDPRSVRTMATTSVSTARRFLRGRSFSPERLLCPQPLSNLSRPWMPRPRSMGNKVTLVIAVRPSRARNWGVESCG